MLFWSIDSMNIIGALRAHEDKIVRMIVDEKSDMIITAGFDTQIKVWKYGARDLLGVVVDDIVLD